MTAAPARRYVIRRAVIFGLVTFVAGGCGGSKASSDKVIEAKEGSDVRLGQLAYRVVMFRELDPAVAAHRALAHSVVPAPRHGLYAVFIRACNRGDEPVAPSAAFRIENASGAHYAPLRDGLNRSLRFRPERLEASSCLPREGTLAERAFDGGALIFELPTDITRDRPLVLEIRPLARSGELARIELDV